VGGRKTAQSSGPIDPVVEILLANRCNTILSWFVLDDRLVWCSVPRPFVWGDPRRLSKYPTANRCI
jgi:hypothetical protein